MEPLLPHENIRDIIETVLNQLEFQYDRVNTVQLAGQIVYSIETKDAHALIGNHGDIIHALDLIIKRIAEKQLSSADGSGELLFLIDVNDYRVKQIKDLETKALVMAERARSFQYDVELSPMSSYERFIVHNALQGAPSVKTESLGEGRSRRVVIKYSPFLEE